eukprot:jgi/Astpho2/4260/Aster-05210
MSRRGLLASGLLVAVTLPSKAQAAGLELPQLPKLQPPDPTKTGGAANRKKLADAEDTFQNSDLLKRMKLIPGMTKSGKQKTPEWLKKVLGQEEGKEDAAR